MLILIMICLQLCGFFFNIFEALCCYSRSSWFGLLQGVNGVVQYPKGFLKEAFELVRERGGVCIADEVSGHGGGVMEPGQEKLGEKPLNPALQSRQKASTCRFQDEGIS